MYSHCKSLTDNFGLADLVFWKDMTLRLVGNFTKLEKMTRLDQLQFDSEHMFRVYLVWWF